MTRARLDHALELIGPDEAARARALEMVRAELMAETAQEAAEGICRTTPHGCRVWRWLRPDGMTLLL